MLSVGTTAGTVAAGDDARLHTQNTDSGTTSSTFQVGSSGSGPKLKNNSGELQVRNSGDSGYADVRCDDLIVEGNLTVNGSGIAIKGKTEGAGRAAFFEVNRSSATDPAVEIKITNTSDAGVGLRVNGLGTGSMLQVQDNGTNVLEVKDGSKIGFYNVTPVARAAALTGSTGTLANAVTRIGEIETALKNIGIIS